MKYEKTFIMNNKYDIYIYSEQNADISVADNIVIKEYQKVANEYRSIENNGNKLRVHLILRSQALVNVLRRLPLEKSVAENIELYAYTIEDLWSMNILGVRFGSNSFINRTSIRPESNERVHLVLFGASALAESLVINSALTLHFPNYCRDNTLRTRITWVSDDINDFNRFKQQYHNLLENSYRRNIIVNGNDVSVNTFAPKYSNERLDFVDIEWEFVECQSYSDIMSYKLNKWSQDEEQQLTIALCYDDEERNLNESLSISIRKDNSIPILIKVKDDTSIQLIKQSNSYKQLVPIGMRDTIHKDMTDFIRMGQYINYAYCKMRDITSEEKKLGATEMLVATDIPSEEDLQKLWNNPKLTTAKRWSNIYNAFALTTKLRSLGYSNEDREKLYAINDKDVDIMAEVEHNRWSVEELILGYVPTSMEEHKEIIADNKKREQYKAEFKHDDLRNYSELGVDNTGLRVARYDIGLTRTLPLIAYANYITEGGEYE